MGEKNIQESFVFYFADVVAVYCRTKQHLQSDGRHSIQGGGKLQNKKTKMLDQYPRVHWRGCSTVMHK